MNKDLVIPRTLPGTMELLPKEQILFDEMKSTIENTYKLYGFLPIDTPVIERADVLLAKTGGEIAQQVYKFAKGDHDICLRFDLTVPLAKYVASNMNELEFPFKRYQIGKVYRGEKAQKGRYREFYQCDIDTIGKESLSIKNDAEYPAIISTIFTNLNIGPFVIYINNRKLMNGLINALGLSELSQDIMRLVDKYQKIGEENVVQTLKLDYHLTDEQISAIVGFLNLNGSNDDILLKLKNFPVQNEVFSLGVLELETVINGIRMLGVPEENFAVNLKIVRGQDYYTGTIYETYLKNNPELGSICGGGRYDNLASHYTETKLPGVGISIGLTRLFYLLNEQKIINSKTTSVSKVLILPMDDSATAKAYQVAKQLRDNNIHCQVYLEDKKFKNKIAYADKLQIPYLIIIGEDEIANKTLTLKDMFNRTQISVPEDQIVKQLKDN